MKTFLRRVAAKHQQWVWLQVFVLWAALSANAQLTATVKPGYTFSANEKPTTATLNQLGRPSITVNGTIAGDTSLSPQSVNGDHLVDDLPDARTLEFTNHSPHRQLGVMASGITKREIANAALGVGLTGGSGALLSVTNVPPSRLLVTVTNGVLIGTLPNTTNVVAMNLTSMRFDSREVYPSDMPITAGVTLVVAHHMGAVPHFVRAVLVAQGPSPQTSFAIGDELDIGGGVHASSASSPFMIGADGTDVWVIQNADMVPAPQILAKNNGVAVALDTTKWRVRIYAMSLP